ncbi:MAG TPA: ABC transporter substrate-binding protein [Gammaproteobacteria bacterium]|nr:ABC transporter substrate-binding protein [Gammaproteobacteria bacterium]
MAFYHRRVLFILALALGFVPAQAPAQIKSNFSSSITSESMAAVWIARDRGLFKKYGLDVQYILMPRSPLAVSALIAGEIDMAVIGPGHLVNAATGGTDVIGIANFAQKLDYRLNTRPEIKKKEDLRGKRIAISGPGSTSHLVSLLALQHLGLDPNAAKIAFLTISGTEINRRLALESGSIDATTLNGSVGDLYGQKGYPVLFNFKGSGVTMPQTMLVTTRRLVSSKPQVVEAYAKTIVEAIAVMFDPANKETVTRTIASNLRLSNPSDAEEAYQSVINSYERVPYPSLEGMHRLHGLLVTINPKLAGIKIDTVVDDSFIRKLDSSGFVQSVSKKH